MGTEPDTTYRCRRCWDKRQRSAVIPLDGALLLVNEPCPFCLELDAPPRQLVRDMATDRIGEIMPSPIPAGLCDGADTRTVWLRPVGGGKEWTTTPEHIQPIDPR